MSKPIKLLFDENYGKPLVRALAGFVAMYSEKGDSGDKNLFSQTAPPEIQSVHDLYGEGSLDETWVPKVAPDGWIVISCDRAKRCGGKKLPDLLAAHNVTHILVSGLLHQEKQFEKARAVIVVWPQILSLRESPLGSRFRSGIASLDSPRWFRSVTDQENMRTDLRCRQKKQAKR